MQVATALRRLGLTHVVDAYVRSALHDPAAQLELSALRREADWRAARWDDDDDEFPTSPPREDDHPWNTLHHLTESFDSSVHSALRCLARRDASGANAARKGALGAFWKI